MIDHLAAQLNDDIYQNIVINVDNSESLINLYLTDRRFQKLLDDKHILDLLAIKFNIIAEILNFTDFMNNCGNFMSPSRFRHRKANKSGSYVLYNVCVETYKVIIEGNQVTVYEIEKDNCVIVWKPNPLKFIVKNIFFDDYDRDYGRDNVSAILLHLDNNRYVFIGFKIYTFLASHKITNFANITAFIYHQEPYDQQYAIDEYNNIYLFLQFVMLSTNRDILTRMMSYCDVYHFYYLIGFQYSNLMMLE